jgi:TolB-like protein
MRSSSRMCLLLIAATVVAAKVDITGQSMENVSTALTPSLQGTTRKTVAVIDFTDLQGAATELGRYLAEELSVTLSSPSYRLNVIDRIHLKAILQEHKLGSSGLIDPLTARQLGRIAGVDSLITGTLTPFGDRIHLSVKALDTETARVLAATVADVPRTQAIDALLGHSVGESSANQSESGQTGSTAMSSAKPQRLQAAGVTIEVARCERSGTCRFVVTAQEDMRFSIPFGIRAWDESGNEYAATTVRIGNQEWGAELIGGVRTPMTMVFDLSGSSLRHQPAPAGQSSPSHPQPSSLSALEIRFQGIGGQTTLRFRNLVLQ